MANYTITEKFTLPSKGLIYSNPINSEVTLRSMTTMDELRRTSPSTKPYSSVCDLIKGCIVGNLGIEVEDLCLADYQFLMHKLRIITYGPEYKMMTRCPFCGKIEDQIFNLESLELHEYYDGYNDLFKLHLVKSRDTENGKVLSYKVDLNVGSFVFIPEEGEEGESEVTETSGYSEGDVF